MKLATFSAGGPSELGVVLDAGLIPISRRLPQLASNMMELIEKWPEAKAAVFALESSGTDIVPLHEANLETPIRRPGKIMAIGLNYADHIAESGAETPKDQVWFAKASTAANGPFDAIAIPHRGAAVDYEAELVAVIGKGGRRLSTAEAPAAVFGYCVGNDATERAWQHRTPQWVVGKSFDTHAPFGPWITTADAIPDPHALGVRCFVNGELRQNSNTSHLVFNLWDQLAHLSQAMTLEPGDLIFTGTPGGVGAAMKPMRFLQPGDTVRVEIDGLGAIENPCALEL